MPHKLGANSVVYVVRVNYVMMIVIVNILTCVCVCVSGARSVHVDHIKCAVFLAFTFTGSVWERSKVEPVCCKL